MAQTRAVTTVVLSILACFATYAVVSHNNSSLPSETVLAEVEAHAHEGVDVLTNIIKLKAYCLSAWDDARMQVNQHSGKYSAIVDFVASYGQEGGGVKRGGRKTQVGNIVSEYADLLAAMRTKYPKGVNKYVLDNLDRAIRHDVNGAIAEKQDMEALGNGGSQGRKFGRLVYIRKKALGFTDRPHIVVQLAAKLADYHHFKAVATQQANNADALAATMFFEAKSDGRYKSFLQREIAKVQRRMRREFDFTAKAAYTAEHAAYEKAYDLDRDAFFKQARVQAGAGRTAAEERAKTLDWSPPTMEQMKVLANKAKEEFMGKFKKDKQSASELIKSITDEVGGVKLFISTTGATDSQSTMQPKVKFVGKDGSFEAKIRTVPGPDSTFVQHFPTARSIGDLKEIVLTGAGTDTKWNVKSIRVRSGGRDANVISMIPSTPQKTFWLKSGQSVTLKPDASAPTNKYERVQCVGWRATDECDGSGSRDKNNDQVCTAEIDSTRSGFCKCDSGAVAKVDCGHDTFTCEEMCKI